jgi:hypothetical protein
VYSQSSGYVRKRPEAAQEDGQQAAGFKLNGSVCILNNDIIRCNLHSPKASVSLQLMSYDRPFNPLFNTPVYERSALDSSHCRILLIVPASAI